MASSIATCQEPPAGQVSPRYSSAQLGVQVTARQGARCVVVRAEKASATNQVAKVFAAVALSAVVSLGAVDAASADVAGLTPCSESKAFAKQQKKEVKALEKRKKNVRSSTSCSTAVAIPPMPPLIVRRV